MALIFQSSLRASFNDLLLFIMPRKSLDNFSLITKNCKIKILFLNTNCEISSLYLRDSEIIWKGVNTTPFKKFEVPENSFYIQEQNFQLKE